VRLHAACCVLHASILIASHVLCAARCLLHGARGALCVACGMEPVVRLQACHGCDCVMSFAFACHTNDRRCMLHVLPLLRTAWAGSRRSHWTRVIRACSCDRSTLSGCACANVRRAMRSVTTWTVQLATTCDAAQHTTCNTHHAALSSL
jgi:hypothetical protein